MREFFIDIFKKINAFNQKDSDQTDDSRSAPTPVPTAEPITTQDVMKAINTPKETPKKKEFKPATTYSEDCVNLVKSFEGCVLTAYKDPVGIWTIGYGHTEGVKEGQVITKQQAETFLKEKLVQFQNRVLRLVKVPLKQNELDALISFVYNVGSGSFSKSTMLRKINLNDKEGAAKEFTRWNKAGGTVLPGLSRRRAAEKKLFES